MRPAWYRIRATPCDGAYSNKAAHRTKPHIVPMGNRQQNGEALVVSRPHKTRQCAIVFFEICEKAYAGEPVISGPPGWESPLRRASSGGAAMRSCVREASLERPAPR